MNHSSSSMKLSLLLLALATGAVAQNAPSTSKHEKTPPLVVEEHPGPPASELKRIDLDFKGGPPAALVEAISKAVGKQVNVIIDESDAQVHLPPIHVRNVTVPDIFSALASATTREVSVPSGRDGFGGGRNIYQTRQVSSQFVPNKPGSLTDDTVWSFVSNEPETEQALINSKGKPKPSLRHYQLGAYLTDKLTVEDITTTIRTGWELLGVKEQPQLKFHKETGILIAAGDGDLLDDIPMVLQQLPTSGVSSLGNMPPPSPPIPRTNQMRSATGPGRPATDPPVK